MRAKSKQINELVQVLRKNNAKTLILIAENEKTVYKIENN